MIAAHPAILGLSAYYHGSAVALVVGDVIADAQEEVSTGVKHDQSLSRQSAMPIGARPWL